MWKVLKSKVLFSSGIFELRSDRCELSDGRVMPNYYAMTFPDWVNVFPVLPDGKILLLRQYRHASGRVHIEIPGGSMDPKLSETPQQAAARELREETGFESGDWTSLGHHYPNPALQNNRVHNYLARNCEKVAQPSLDPYEELETFLVEPAELEDFIDRGDLDHTIMLASVSMALRALRKA